MNKTADSSTGSFAQFLNDHSRAIIFFFAALALAGGLAYTRLPSDVYPSLTFPRIAIIASTGDTAPERALLSTTRILEEAAGQVYHVKRVRSKTIRGSAELSVEFEDGADLNNALHQLQARVAEVQTQLPPGVALTIEPVTPAIFPILSYNVTTDSLTQADLYNICRYQLTPPLSRVAGVARTQIQGGDQAEISVQVDLDKLKNYRLSISTVADALSRINQLQVIGRLTEAHQQSLLIAGGEADTLAQLGDVVVGAQSGQPIYLKDVATIQPGHRDRLSLVSVRQKKAVVINVFKQPAGNVVEVAHAVHEELAKLAPTLPPGLTIEPAYNESALVISALNNVFESIGVGIALIVVVLFAFLRSLKSTLIAALSIPLSALAAFGVLYCTGQNLNLMSLGGLAIAIGLVIDDAIVVIENISRQLSQSPNSRLAVSQALSELTGPVTSSTITTVVVFLPLGLLSGVAGQFFTSLTITLAAAVIFSWVLALTLMPLLAAKLLREKKVGISEKHTGRLEKVYASCLRLFLRAPWLSAIVAIALTATTPLLYGKLTSDFLPAVDEGNFVLDYLAPPGIALDDMDKLADRLEAIVARTPEVVTWTRRSGAELGLFATQSNKGDILVVLKPSSTRKRAIDEIMEEERAEIAATLPQLQVDFHQILQDELNDLSGAPRPVEVRVYGEDPTVLRSWCANISELIKDVPGLADLSTTSELGAPQNDLLVDVLAAERMGLAAADVTRQVQDGLIGRNTSQIRQGDRYVPIRIRFPDILRNSVAALQNFPIFGVNGSFQPLSTLAKTVNKAAEGQIFCENQQRYASVEAEIEKRDLGSTIIDVKKKIEALRPPAGYRLEVAGLYATQQQSFKELLAVIALSILLVYFVLVMQFRAFMQPLAVLISIPLAVFGVLIALNATTTSLNVSSFMGIILLIGLVVKNGIILLDYANQLYAKQLYAKQVEAEQPIEDRSTDSLPAASRTDCVIQAAIVRLRPILMTTICTLLGLVPLAYGHGSGAEMQKPLAIAVIGGLSFSTLFTLFLVPAAYIFLSGDKRSK